MRPAARSSARAASARLAASSAALVTPAPTWGRATKAASPKSATRPNTVRGDARSKIGWKKGCGVRAKISAPCGGTSARAVALVAAGASGPVTRGRGAAGEDGGNAMGSLLDWGERHAEPIARGRQRIPQRAIEPAPGAHGARGLLLVVGAAGAVEADDGVDLDPHGFVEVDADAMQNVDELRMRADAGAAAGQILGVALEHDDVPADVAQQMRGQQSAERA